MSDDSTPHSVAAAHRTYTSLAESALREMVLDGRLVAGERLNEVALSNELEISRGPIREAVNRLVSKGLLISVSHRGAYVRSFSRAELGELYDLRIALETYAVRVGVERAGGGEIRALEESLVTTAAILEEPGVTRYPADLDFHTRVVALAHNSALHQAFDGALGQITLARSRSSSDPSRARRALSEHQEVVAAITRRDAATAEKRLERHLRSALENAFAVLDLD